MNGSSSTVSPFVSGTKKRFRPTPSASAIFSSVPRLGVICPLSIRDKYDRETRERACSWLCVMLRDSRNWRIRWPMFSTVSRFGQFSNSWRSSPGKSCRRRRRNDERHLRGQQTQTATAIARPGAVLHQSAHLTTDYFTVHFHAGCYAIFIRHRISSQTFPVKRRGETSERYSRGKTETGAGWIVYSTPFLVKPFFVIARQTTRSQF